MSELETLLTSFRDLDHFCFGASHLRTALSLPTRAFVRTMAAGERKGQFSFDFAKFDELSSMAAWPNGKASDYDSA